MFGLNNQIEVSKCKNEVRKFDLPSKAIQKGVSFAR